MTKCKHGHDLTPDNIHFRAGVRGPCCSTCRRESRGKYRADPAKRQRERELRRLREYEQRVEGPRA